MNMELGKNKDAMPEKLIHRDDIPMDVMEDIQELFPDMKIVCAGDIPEGQIPEDMREAIATIEAKFLKSIVEGKCVDCGKKIHDFPPVDWSVWKLPDGWRYFTDFSGSPQAFQCPECDREDGECHA
jgi:hypothetical protein